MGRQRERGKPGALSRAIAMVLPRFFLFPAGREKGDATFRRE